MSTPTEPERPAEVPPAEPAPTGAEAAADPDRRRPAGRGRTVTIVAVAALVVVVAAVIGIRALSSSGGGVSAPGECASATGTGDDAKAEIVDCGSDKALFKVALTKPVDDKSCPDGAYREARSGDLTLCLMPNFVAEKCYTAEDASQGFKVSECSSSEAIRISKVLEGTSDPSGCPDNGSGLGYPQPPVVFCIDTQPNQ